MRYDSPEEVKESEGYNGASVKGLLPCRDMCLGYTTEYRPRPKLL